MTQRDASLCAGDRELIRRPHERLLSYQKAGQYLLEERAETVPARRNQTNLKQGRYFHQGDQSQKQMVREVGKSPPLHTLGSNSLLLQKMHYFAKGSAGRAGWVKTQLLTHKNLV